MEKWIYLKLSAHGSKLYRELIILLLRFVGGILPEKRLSKFQTLVTILKFWLSYFAVRWCDCYMLYWADPKKWDSWFKQDIVDLIQQKPACKDAKE